MKFYVEDKVLDTGVKILFALIEGVDNHSIHKEWQQYRAIKINELAQEYCNTDFHADPILESYNILHDKSNVKRRKNISASENLIRTLQKHGDIPAINQVVDIYNVISVESRIALGAHDCDKVTGNVTLRFTDGTETFQPIGQQDATLSNPHEYSYCDDSNEVLCRLEIRQVEKTKVTEDTHNLFYIIQGNDSTSLEYLQQTAEKIISLTVKYCGGTGKIIVPEIITTD